MSSARRSRFPKGIKYLPGLRNKFHAPNRQRDRALSSPLVGSKKTRTASVDAPWLVEIAGRDPDQICDNERSAAPRRIKINSFPRIDLSIIPHTSREKTNSALIQKQFRSIVTLSSPPLRSLRMPQKRASSSKNKLFYKVSKSLFYLFLFSNTYMGLPCGCLVIFPRCADVRKATLQICSTISLRESKFSICSLLWNCSLN